MTLIVLGFFIAHLFWFAVGVVLFWWTFVRENPNPRTQSQQRWWIQ